MSYYISGTAVTPAGALSPLYRVSSSACNYNSFIDSTGCSCIIYTDAYDDLNTICQTDSASTAYFWTARDTCLTTGTEGAWVKLIDQDGHVDSTTGSEYCSGVFKSDGELLTSALSMPIGSDPNIKSSSATSTTSSASSTSTAMDPSSSLSGGGSSSTSGDWTTTSFTGPCRCQQYMCYESGGCDSPEVYDGVNQCTSGSTSILAESGKHFGCFYVKSNSKETQTCECKPVSEDEESSSISTSSIRSAKSTSNVASATTTAGGSVPAATGVPVLSSSAASGSTTSAVTSTSQRTGGGSSSAPIGSKKMGSLILALLSLSYCMAL